MVNHGGFVTVTVVLSRWFCHGISTMVENLTTVINRDNNRGLL